MDIKSTLAASAYTGARPATTPAAREGNGDPSGLVRSFTETLRQNEETAKQAMTGAADPQALVQALAESQLAVEAAVSVRDRVVEAYQEILRMPV
jgi:flagellar hook-basal body complex protein FliE